MEKCSRCKKKITKETGRNVSIHKTNFQYGEAKETIYCDDCHNHNRAYRGRTTEEMRLASKATCKVFSRKEIKAVENLYKRRSDAT